MAKAEQDIEDFRLHTDFSRKIRPFNSTLTFVGNRTDMKRVGPLSTELEAQTNLSVYYDDDSQQVAIWTVTASKAEIETARKAFDQVTERLNSSGVDVTDLQREVKNIFKVGRLPHSVSRPAVTINHKRGGSKIEAWFYLGLIHRETDASLILVAEPKNEGPKVAKKVFLILSKPLSAYGDGSDLLTGSMDPWPAQCDQWKK